MSKLITGNNFDLEEWDENEPIAPPAGVPIVRPFKDVTHFWPNDQPQREDVSWVVPYEKRYLEPLGNGVGKVFGVNLINDQEYITLPEDIKATHLFCVLTRANIQERHPGKFVWHPICVVVKYVITVAIEVMLDRANQQIDITKMFLWSNQQQTYAPVFDEKTGKIQNPAVLLQILERYSKMEGFE